MIDVLQVLNQAGAVLTDRHFVYKSTKHGPHYINMDNVFPDTLTVQTICELLGEPFRCDGVDVVVAAATGGIPLAYGTALSLGVQFAWADKIDDNEFAFKRSGFGALLAGMRVLIVEDLLNTGDTVKKVADLVRAAGGHVVGISVVCNRGSETADSLDIPRLNELSAVEFTAVPAGDCELCAAEVPIVEDIGHGDLYKITYPYYPGGFVVIS